MSVCDWEAAVEDAVTCPDLSSDDVRFPGCLCRAPQQGPARFIEVTLHDASDAIVELFVPEGAVIFNTAASASCDSTLLWGEASDGE